MNILTTISNKPINRTKAVSCLSEKQNLNCGDGQNFESPPVTKNVMMKNLNLIDLKHNRYAITYKRACRFLEVAFLLHLTSILGLAIFLGFGILTISDLEDSTRQLFIMYGCFSVFGIVLTVFAQMDAYSRLQNYKVAKDLFFENGFQKRIVNLFIRSRCQREAIKIAAIDLGIIDELNLYYTSLGYQWFHLIPDVTFHNPKFFFTWNFWKRTFFVPPYRSKYFSW